MSRIGADKFRFVSPGIQTAEIDLSRRPGEAEDAGPMLQQSSANCTGGALLQRQATKAFLGPLGVH